MVDYNPKEIEAKWRAKWAKNPMKAEDGSKKPKYYELIEFPYPSGSGLHVGHCMGYTASDVHARVKRMQGYNVLFPIGWDAFGLPTENYAIKTGRKPTEVTKENTDTFRKQMKSLGYSFDFDREVNTTDPNYYKWTQWIFLQFYRHAIIDGKLIEVADDDTTTPRLAYQAEMPINWCPSCKIGLANEEVINGKCERCGTETFKKMQKQWMLRITAYADRLIEDLKLTEYLENIKTAQINWIGKSVGSNIRFEIVINNHSERSEESSPDVHSGHIDPSAKPQDDKSAPQDDKLVIEVFTTRTDTLYGCTYVVLAPEHRLLENLKSSLCSRKMDVNHVNDGQISNLEEVEKYIKEAKKKSDLERTELAKEKTGVKLEGIKAVNPINGEEVDVWVADYVLANYGTGAVMAVPAHDERDFEFAKKYNIPIKEVIIPKVIDKKNPPQDGKEAVSRRSIQAIIINPKDGKVLNLKLKKFPWTTFVVGGVEGDESIEEAARREILEETGYKNLKFIKTLGGPVESHFYAAHKGVNRKGLFSTLVFELIDDERSDAPEVEQAIHSVKWNTWDEISKDPNLTCAEYLIWRERFNNPEKAFTDYGVMINSGEFDGLSSEEGKVKVTEKLKSIGAGDFSVNYKLRDWVFSRQHYWGEPIPIVHCEKCAVEKYRNDAKLTINFYNNDIWSKILSGAKTIESRALNPEESERFFGNIKENDLIISKNKNSNEEKIFKISKIYKFNNFVDLFADKKVLEKISLDKVASAQELEKEYDKLAPSYADKIKKNGLVCWEFKILSKLIPLDENELPVELPEVEKYEPTNTGESPLAAIDSWVNTTCPKCGDKVKRETDTMPNWAGSSWYFLRYCDPHNDNELADREKLVYWMPVDLYNGGNEHTTLHLLYSRFWHKFLFDLGVVPGAEPYKKRIAHGIILGPDGQKMSKSKGNVINPDDVAEEFGADAMRTYIMFIGPYDQESAWSTSGLQGVVRFLNRVWKNGDKVVERHIDDNSLLVKLNKGAKKIDEDIENFSNNTYVAMLMEINNEFDKHDKISKESFAKYLKVLYPAVPHLASEMWEMLEIEGDIAVGWVGIDEKYLIDTEVKVAVQVNGKLRGTVTVLADSSEKDVITKINTEESINKWIEGKEIAKTFYVADKILSIVTKQPDE